MSKSRSPWHLAIPAALFTMAISAAGAQETSAVPAPSKAGKPHELKLLRFTKNVTPTDLRGVGRNDDLVIRYYVDTGIVSSPEDYVFLAKPDDDPTSELLPVVVPGIDGGEDWGTSESEDMDCIVDTFRLGHSLDKRTFMVRARRNLPHGKSPIRVQLLELVEDFDKSVGDKQTHYRFSVIESHDVVSVACIERALIKLESTVLHLKLRE